MLYKLEIICHYFQSYKPSPIVIAIKEESKSNTKSPGIPLCDLLIKHETQWESGLLLLLVLLFRLLFRLLGLCLGDL